MIVSGFILYTGIFYALIFFCLHDSSVKPAHLDTEFWNREDEASISAEDISDSDGRIAEHYSFHFIFRRYLWLLFGGLERTNICSSLWQMGMRL
jgi:hypothetical protein